MNPLQSAARYKLRLLGDFSLTRAGEPRPLVYEKSRALLAWLALEGAHPHPRDALAERFWPDLARGAALTNLRQILADLRAAFAENGDESGGKPSPLRIDRDTVHLDLASGIDVDVLDCLAADPACPPLPADDYCRTCLETMQAHSERLGNELLAGLRLPECTEFTGWLQARREAVRQRWQERQLRLAECRAARGDAGRALADARDVLAAEPTHEGALRQTLMLLAARNDTAAALKEYQRFATRLQRDYRLVPGAETRALVDYLRLRQRTDSVGAPASIQRRQVGVLACEIAPGLAGEDLVDDDPEAHWQRLAGPEHTAREVLERHGARIVQIRGGSLLAYFGHAGGSENTVLAAIAATREIRQRLAVDAVDIRFGIHSGLILCGDPGLPDPTGLVSGLAVALRQQAGADDCLVSAEAWTHLAGYYTASAVPVRGSDEDRLGPLAYRLDAASGADTRLDAACARGALLPLCGRTGELAALCDAWRDLVGNGQAAAVLLRGEPGIGKSRLALALAQSVRDGSAGRAGQAGLAPTVHHLHCSAEHAATPFHPFAAWLDAPAAVAAPGGVHEKPGNEAHAKADEKAHDERADSPERRRERRFTRLLDTLAGAGGPVLLLLEDLQWADPSTLEFIGRVLDAGLPCLLCLTARPEFVAPWPAGQCRPLALERLAEADIATLAAAALPQRGEAAAGAPADLVRLIVERADGVPLFAEELARGAAAHRPTALPGTLIELLMACLDAAGDARVLLDIAAVIGRDFDLALLRRCLPAAAPAALSRATFAHALARLVELRLIECAAGQGSFRHALIRDAAYQAQTHARRAETHRRIADQLRRVEVPPELLARHRAAAGEAGAAIAAWLLAGRMAARQAACREALAHFRAGLELLPRLADPRQRASHELELSIGLGAAACAADGYASAEGAAAYSRAMALCNAGQVEAGDETFAAIWGLWASASSRVGYDGAHALARQLLRLAADSADPVPRQQAHFAVGDTAYWRGDFAGALHHLAQVEAIWRPAHHARQIERFGEDAGVTAAAYRGWVLHLLGRIDDARAAADLAIARARDLGHPFSEAYALAFAALLHCRLRQPRVAAALASRTLVLAERHGFALWRLVALIVQGWSRAQQGDAAGADGIGDCLAGMRAAMGGVTVAVLVPYADALLGVGRHAEARAAIDEALALAAALGDSHALTELARLDGLAHWQAGDPDAAGAAFRRGLALARRQGIPLAELRLLLARADCAGPRGPSPKLLQSLATLTAGLSPHGDCPDLAAARSLG